jgi:protein-tyrosine-phosphatase
LIGENPLFTVLFICVHNAGRSQMAEAFFNSLSKGRYKALSAGSRPSEIINPVVVEAMREVGGVIIFSGLLCFLSYIEWLELC